MWIRNYRRAAPLAAIAALLMLAGFGCKPILDAGARQAQKQAEQTASIWLPEDPVINSYHGPDLYGGISIDLRSKPGTTITVEVFGPGILKDPYQKKDADKDGRVHFEWKTNRIGHYKYHVSITYNRVEYYNFDDEFDTDVNR